MIKSPRLSKRVLENEILSRRERIRRFKKVSELGEIDLKGDDERNGFISHSWQRPSRRKNSFTISDALWFYSAVALTSESLGMSGGYWVD